MPSWLQNLREKSPETRHRIALGTSISVTCLIFVMWITVLNFGGGSEAESLQARESGETQTASPLSAFGDNAASAFRQLKRGVSGADDEHVADSSTTEETNSEADSDSFWGDAGRSERTSQTSEEVKQEDSSKEEPFTSRNYNPSEEGDWFAH